MGYSANIIGGLDNCLEYTDFDFGTKKKGKVRDKYILDDKIIMITTDRQSAFDKVLAKVPYKGQVLNQTSAWWFSRTKHIIDNHVIETSDPNAMVVKRCEVFPIEFIVRGYMTGSTDTSVWTNYQKGVRVFCGNPLPEGMRKNQKFPISLVTPTTKSDKGDCNISPQEIVEQGHMNQGDLDFCIKKAKELFRFGQATAKLHGLVLVDTKYEFGKDKDGSILLIDEIHTPDSSRYWIDESYEERFLNGQEPENIDKEFLRLWFKENCDPYKDENLPQAPQELIVELSKRYIQLYEMITNEKFDFSAADEPIYERVKRNLSHHLPVRNKIEEPIQKIAITSIEEVAYPSITVCEHIDCKKNEVPSSDTVKAVIIMGSSKDEDHAKKITNKLSELDIVFEKHIASAHKNATELLEILNQYKNQKVMYITIAGRSNALSGFMAGNSDKVVIACPPFVDKLDMMVNINSTLQMPSLVPVLTILDPHNCALAIKRIIDQY